MLQKHSSPPYTTYFHFNYCVKATGYSTGTICRHQGLVQWPISGNLTIWSFKHDYTARYASSDHYHPTTGTFKPHSSMDMDYKFQFGRGGGIILVWKRVMVLHHGVHQMMQYRLYEGLLYFQNVIQFQGTYPNVIPFMLITKVLP